MIKPIQQNESLIADIQRVKNTKGLHIWWLGQSGFLLHHESGACILFDPYLSDSLPRKYENTAKPHERVSEIVVDPALLFEIDVVTSSHNHTDHLDAETLQPILKNNPAAKFIIPEANRQFAVDRVGCELDFPIGMNDGMEVKINDFITIYGFPAAHNQVDRDEQGQCKYMGFVAKIGDFSVYHSGDTLLYDGLIDLLKPFKVDVAFLPINGNEPSRGVAGNLNAQEAAFVAKSIGAKCVIPHHYDMFKFNTADPKIFEAECQKEGINYKVLQLGERLSL